MLKDLQMSKEWEKLKAISHHILKMFLVIQIDHQSIQELNLKVFFHLFIFCYFKFSTFLFFFEFIELARESYHHPSSSSSSSSSNSSSNTTTTLSTLTNTSIPPNSTITPNSTIPSPQLALSSKEEKGILSSLAELRKHNENLRIGKEQAEQKVFIYFFLLLLLFFFEFFDFFLLTIIQLRSYD